MCKSCEWTRGKSSTIQLDLIGLHNMGSTQQISILWLFDTIIAIQFARYTLYDYDRYYLF